MCIAVAGAAGADSPRLLESSGRRHDAATELFVSPQGSDAHPGTEAQPFASLHQAQEGARQAVWQGPVTVWLKQGTYTLSRPLIFTERDSGRRDAPVTYAAAPGAEVVISGGNRLDLKWRPYQQGIWQANVPSACRTIDQLFVNSKRRSLARWPNFKAGAHGLDAGYSQGLEGVAGPAFSRVDPPLQDYAGLTFDPTRFTRRQWRHPELAMLHVFQSKGWGNMQWRLRGIDYQEKRISLGRGGWQIGTLWEQTRANWVKGNSRFYIENIFEELDHPGEWYHDAQKQILYYHPVVGEDVTRAEIVACGLTELVVFMGSAAQPVKNVHLRGLSFQHTARTLLEPYETRLRGDWAIARRAAVRFDGAEQCSVTDCQFKGLGGNAVLLSNYNRRVDITDSLFTDIGDSAVLVVGANDAVREFRVHRSFHVPLDQLTDIERGPKSPNYPGNCRIHNNLMVRLGVFGKQVAGVYLSACERIHISHNTICLVPRAAICINDGCWGGHVIEYNDAFLTVLETADHGPLNAWGRDRFWQSPHRVGQACDMSLSRAYARLDNYLTTVIRNNRFVDDGFSWGIDLDDGASNYLVTNNLCIGCSVKLREGYFRHVKNNIFVGPNPPNKHCCFVGSDDSYTHNIYVNTRDHWALNRGPSTEVLPKEMDGNLYFCLASESPVFGYRQCNTQTGKMRRFTHSFVQWQGLGVDQHSRIADPCFVNREAGDYHLQAHSPALTLGFKPFPLDRFGTQRPAFKRLLQDLGLDSRTEPQTQTLYVWMGGRIRDTEKGIAFVEVPVSSEAYRHGFRSQDLLLQMNKVPVGSVESLIGMISGAAIRPTPFRVRRDRQDKTIVAEGPGGVPVKD